MNEGTIIIYENAIGTLRFAYESTLWVTDVDGLSSVEIDISASHSTMQTGSSITGQSIKPRSFTMDGAIFEPIAPQRELVLNIMAPKIPATLTIEQNGEAWYLDVVPEKTPEVTSGNGVQFFQVRLYAAYPYWRTTTSYARQVAGLDALFKFPIFTGGTWWVSRYSDSYFTTIENRGNVPVEFRAVFTARTEIEDPELYHVEAGKRILIRKTMVAGERVVVSTVYGNKGITCIDPAGTATNGFKYLSVDSDLSMTLNPGSNLLRIDAVNREGLGVRIEAPEGGKSGV